MSLSKEQLLVAAAEEPRQPKCTRCRHHGIIVPQKGHMKYCPFLKCDCWKCYLITQRTRIAALQRNLKRTQSKKQRPCAHTGVSAAEGTCCASAPDGGARPSATSALTRPPSGGAPEPAAAIGRPLDLRVRSAAGGENVAGLGNRNVPPFASSEERPCRPSTFNAPYFGEFGQTAALPVFHFPFRMSGHYPSSYAPCPNFLLNMPPLPAGLYNEGLCGPLMFPHFQAGDAHYPPSPEPGPAADCRQVFFTLPEPFQDQRMPRQPPLPKHTEKDIEELD